MAALAANHLALDAAGFGDHGSDNHVTQKGSYTETQIWGGNMPLTKDTIKDWLWAHKEVIAPMTEVREYLNQAKEARNALLLQVP